VAEVVAEAVVVAVAVTNIIGKNIKV